MGKNDDLPLAAFASILGAAIRSRRTAMGLSTSELARRSNGKITRSAIALIEAGKVDARMGSLRQDDRNVFFQRGALQSQRWAMTEGRPSATGIAPGMTGGAGKLLAHAAYSENINAFPFSTMPSRWQT